jgi:TetR/AcrR family transcriptional regulator, tetracycline repressor protein
MRRLGKELDVEAMSLYRYVNGREDLLEGIVDHLVAQLHLESAGDQLQQTGGWQANLQWLAHGVRQLARQHPDTFPLIATRHPAAPWLRPPLRSLWWSRSS